MWVCRRNALPLPTLVHEDVAVLPAAHEQAVACMRQLRHGERETERERETKRERQREREAKRETGQRRNVPAPVAAEKHTVQPSAAAGVSSLPILGMLIPL
jgi:hypothetical protein